MSISFIIQQNLNRLGNCYLLKEIADDVYIVKNTITNELISVHSSDDLKFIVEIGDYINLIQEWEVKNELFW